MAQTPDGMLWLSSPTGLYRFDGETFDDSVSERLPSRSLFGLYVASNGDLWVGYTFGGVGRLRAGQFTDFGTRGLPPGSIRLFVEDNKHVVWALSTRGLSKFDGSSWQAVGLEAGYSGLSARWIGMCGDDLIVTTSTDTFLRPGGSDHFERRSKEFGYRIQFRIPAGATFDPDTAHVETDDPADSFVDSTGRLWASNTNGGLQRFDWREGAPRSTETYGVAEGLSEVPTGFFEDREGNMWVGFASGMVRFSTPRLHPVALRHSVYRPLLVAADNGAIDVFDNRGLTRIAGDSVTFENDVEHVPAATRTRDGAIWMAADDGRPLVRLFQGHNTPIDLPSELTQTAGLRGFQALGEDEDGAMWISIAKRGLYRWKDGVTQDSTAITPALPKGPAIRLLADDKKRLWFTYPDNAVAVLEHGRFRTFSHEDGLDIGNVVGIAVRGSRVWLSGDRGAAGLIGDRFVPIIGIGGEQFDIADGIVETRHGDLWFNARKGLYRVPREEVNRWLSGDTAPVKFELFGRFDGLDSAVVVVRPWPGLLEDDKNRLWIARLAGVWWMDPEHLFRNEVAPIVVIDSVTAGEVTYPSTTPIVLPRLTRDLSIRYTAASLTSPKQTHFHYRLSGLDEGWHDVGDRREAFYSNMMPGHYRFEVWAQNEDGVKSKESALFSFEIAPMLYQMLWFRFLCLGLALLVAAWLVYLRLEQTKLRLRQSFALRHAERERIARDLHDTLLQGIQGLLFRLRVWAKDASLPATQREEMALVAEQTRTMVIEGRDRISALRQASLAHADFADALKTVASTEGAGQSATFSMTIEGEEHALIADGYEHALEIAREAVRNAYRHARATRIGAHIEYRKSSLRITIADDGCGIRAAAAVDVSASGHFGILGMRERASQLRAVLRMGSGEKTGTTVELTIPAATIYA